MKYQNLKFLSKAYIKGNKNSKTIRIVTCLLIVAITVISSFAIVTVNAMNESKEDYKSRALFLSPWIKPLTDDVIEKMLSIEHIEHIDDCTAIYGINSYDIVDTNDKDFKSGFANHKVTSVDINGLYEHENKRVIAGKSLDATPVYSCIIPSIFYPFEDNDGNINYNNLDYIDGTKLIGKIITVKGSDGNICVPYNIVDENNQCLGVETYLSSPEIKLNIVGTYYCSRANSGSFRNIFVSRDTILAITKDAFKKSGVDINDNDNDNHIAKWWNTPSLHSYIVVADDYDNISAVFNEVTDIGYDIANSPEWLMSDNTILLANLFGKIGVFFIIAIFIIAVIIMIQSSVTEIKRRRGFIGLLKAMGYKNKQILACLSLEQFYIVLTSFVIGNVISTAIVATTNYIFMHGSYAQMVYVIDWKIFFVFMAVALAITVLIPIICLVVMLHTLNKIQPREAMN